MSRLSVHSVPGRAATGAYVLHAGIDKWHASPDRAQGLHRAASTAFPWLRPLPPALFARVLSATEMGIGSALLVPLVRNRVAGLLLTAFSGSLLTMYWRSPAMRRAHSVWPTPAGVPVSKDVWMLGIALGLVLDDLR